jgi:site-specific DNA recombinase
MVEAFSHALRARLLEGGAGFPKRYLRHFVTDIRFDGKRVTMTRRKAALLEAVAEKKMGTARVPTSSCRWLPDQGSNLGPADQQPRVSAKKRHSMPTDATQFSVQDKT